MNFPPDVWGPFFWHTIHIVAFGYPQKPTYAQKKAAKEFYESLSVLIPCPICREHYVQHLEKLPLTPHLDSRKDLFKWTVVLHNEVNTMLKKPTWTEQEVIAYYKRLGARGKSPVISHTNFEEADWRAYLRGIGIGAGGVLTLGGILYLASK